MSLADQPLMQATTHSATAKRAGEASSRRLRYVRVSGNAPDLRLFPDFLILGPQRTGTTWLHAHLRFHPEIFLAEPKELFFFSSLKDRAPSRFRSDELGWYTDHFRDPLWRAMAKNVLTLWRYGELYRPKVRGEATASYAALDPEVIDDVVALNPDIKGILMVRDPVERAWSHAKKDLVRKRGRRIEDVPAEEFRAFFTDPYQLRCARYVQNSENWAARLRPGHLLVRFFREIATDPASLLLDLMEFLGVRADRRYLGTRLADSVNPTGAGRIPEEHRRFLAELLAEDVRRLEARFGASWKSPG